MYDMTRRAILAGALLAALLLVAPLATAADPELGGITIRADGRICEREARQRIEAIIRKMISAGESRAPGLVSNAEQDAFLDNGWKDAREILAQHYPFYD